MEKFVIIYLLISSILLYFPFKEWDNSDGENYNALQKIFMIIIMLFITPLLFVIGALRNRKE